MPKVKTKKWGYSEEKFLIEHYNSLTIKELEQYFQYRSRESLYNKIKRLKRNGKIKEGVDDATRERAYYQRGKSLKGEQDDE